MVAVVIVDVIRVTVIVKLIVLTGSLRFIDLRWLREFDREREEGPPTEPLIADEEDDSPESPMYEDQEEDGAPFPPLMPQDSKSLECVTLQRAVEEKLVELATMVVQDNQACAAALLEQYETQCFRVEAVPRI